MPYDWLCMARMAKPKRIHPFHIPDRASVYWLDYLIDPRPMQITNPEELKKYYDQEVKKFPSAVRLSKPKCYRDENLSEVKPLTNYGISTTALNYKASDRIKELAKFPYRRYSTLVDLETHFDTSISNKLQKRPNTDDQFLNRNRSDCSSKHQRNFGKGDYRSSSPYEKPILQRSRSALIKSSKSQLYRRSTLTSLAKSTRIPG